MAGWSNSIRPFSLLLGDKSFDIVKPVVTVSVVKDDEIAVSDFIIDEFRMRKFPRYRIKLLCSADGVVFDPANFDGFRVTFGDRSFIIRQLHIKLAGIVRRRLKQGLSDRRSKQQHLLFFD